MRQDVVTGHRQRFTELHASGLNHSTQLTNPGPRMTKRRPGNHVTVDQEQKYFFSTSLEGMREVRVTGIRHRYSPARFRKRSIPGVQHLSTPAPVQHRSRLVGEHGIETVCGVQRAAGSPDLNKTSGDMACFIAPLRPLHEMDNRGKGRTPQPPDFPTENERWRFQSASTGCCTNDST